MMLSFQYFGRIVGYHDENCMKKVKQGGNKPGKHRKPGKLREFEKLSKSHGKLREILIFVEKTWKTQGK